MNEPISNQPISVDVMLFAGAADLAETRTTSVSVPRGSTIADLQRQLMVRHPTLAQLAAVSRWAVGTDFVDDDFQIQQPIQIAMIPPVSGG